MTTMLWIYLLCVNVTAFLLYGLDKRRAIKDKWRIPEATLLGIAFMGGSLGAWAGMQTFRHKTKQWKFKFLVPLFLLMQIGLIWYLMF